MTKALMERVKIRILRLFKACFKSRTAKGASGKGPCQKTTKRSSNSVKPNLRFQQRFQNVRISFEWGPLKAEDGRMDICCSFRGL